MGFFYFLFASILKIVVVFVLFSPQTTVYLDASIFEYFPQIFQLLYLFLKF
jgi:hypothetical protein